MNAVEKDLRKEFNSVRKILDEGCCREKLILENSRNYVMIEFSSKEENILISASDSHFKLLFSETILLSDINKSYCEDGEELTDAVIAEYGSDIAYSIVNEICSSGIKGLNLDFDESVDDSDYFRVTRRSVEHYVVGDSVLYRIEADCYAHLSDIEIDLTKFVCRRYDTPEDFPASTGDKGKSDFDSMVGHASRGIDGKRSHIYFDGKIDAQLLKSYVYHQAMSKMFDVKFDPFFEKDELIHVKCRKYGEKEPEYNIPDCVIGFKQSIKTWQFGRKYHDHEYLFN